MPPLRCTGQTKYEAHYARQIPFTIFICRQRMHYFCVGDFNQFCCEKIMHVRSFCMQWTQHAFYIDYTQWLHFDLYFIWQVNVKNFVSLSYTVLTEQCEIERFSSTDINQRSSVCNTKARFNHNLCMFLCMMLDQTVSSTDGRSYRLNTFGQIVIIFRILWDHLKLSIWSNWISEFRAIVWAVKK